MIFTEIVDAAHRVEWWLRRMRQPLAQAELDRALRDVARPLDAAEQCDAVTAARHAVRATRSEEQAAN